MDMLENEETLEKIGKVLIRVNWQFIKIISERNINQSSRVLEWLEQCPIKAELEMAQNEISSGSPKPVTYIKEYIMEHYAEDIFLSRFVKELYLNRSYLSRLFKEETGLTFKKYLIEYRMIVAKELMKDKTIKFYQISEMVGYKDPSYFSRIFKSMTGKRPTDY